MNECIDIYSRLIIATITFVGPIIIALLSSFSEGEKRRKDLTRQTEEELSQKVAREVQNNPAKIRETIHKTNEEYKKLDKEAANELGRLNPIIQFWLIYGPLSSSLILLSFDFLIRKNTWGLYSHKLSCWILAISLSTYLASVFSIVRVFFTIVRTKRII